MSKEYLTIDCPKISENRLEEMKTIIEGWIKSDILINLVKEFDNEIPLDKDLLSLSNWFVDFSEIWDYRKKQQNAFDSKTGEVARWLVEDEENWSQEKKNFIIESARILGLIDSLDPKDKHYDYFLVLGGARLTCLQRPKLAAMLVYEKEFRPEKIVLLSTSRPVSESERSTTDTYAKNAKTEFDLILSGSKEVFELGKELRDMKYNDGSKNKSWQIIEYSENEKTPQVIAISAPSSEPEKRRANSADTYEFFFENYNIKKGSKLLLLTSQIYVPYQHMEAIRTLAFKHDVIVETIGVPTKWTKLKGMRNSVHYLQEIRATLVSINRFLKQYC